MVTIMVTDVDEAPEISEGGLAITGMISVEYAEENGTGMVATYSATGPESANAIVVAWWRRRRGLQNQQQRSAHLQEFA